jgi:hypothetical protein
MLSQIYGVFVLCEVTYGLRKIQFVVVKRGLIPDSYQRVIPIRRIDPKIGFDPVQTGRLLRL